jgi:diguanylate cyclase (GGDEF)-like protein
LRQFGHRLHGCVRDADVIAKFADEIPSHHISRLGGDEFTIILNHIYDKKMIVSVAERIISAYGKPFYLSGHEVVVTGSVGIATSDMDGLSCDKMVKCADLAMYHAKQAGKNSYKIYSSDDKDLSE